MWVCFLREREKENVCVCLVNPTARSLRGLFTICFVPRRISLSRALQGRNNRHLEREKIFGDCFDGGFRLRSPSERTVTHHKTAN